jgi:hypothetical protein
VPPERECLSRWRMSRSVDDLFGADE